MAAQLQEVLERARRLGVLGPGPIEDHIAHAGGFLRALEGVTGQVLDLGSGAGVPGLIIAVERADLHLVLLDAQERRVALLEEAIAALELPDRPEVLHGRAEELAHRADLRGRFAAVTARSFGPPAVVAECGAPFLSPGGRLVVSEPPDQPDRWPADGLARLGLSVGDPVEGGVRTLIAEAAAPDDVPRRVGIPAKRPLF